MLDFCIMKFLLKEPRQCEEVYNQEPAMPVLISTSGTSPCEGCPVIGELDGRGGHGGQ